MLNRPTMFVLIALASVGFSRSALAASCAEVDATTIKVLADAFGADEKTLNPSTRLSGRFRLDETQEGKITEALEEKLDISENDWREDNEWNTVEDVLEEVRHITGCGKT